MTLRTTALILLLTTPAIPIHAQAPQLPEDKYRWLEDVNGEKPLAWVKAENARTSKVLESDPHFPELEAAALKVLESQDRLATPEFVGNAVYNTWRDAEHVRGILRRTTLSDYLTAKPNWQTILDYDALAKQDNEKWVAKGMSCIYPGDDLCLVRLSAGGEDAVTIREFSLKSGRFVENGFVLPRSKQNVAWVDRDTLLVARDWGAGTMSKSGYPIVVKLWKRGQPLDQAHEVYRVPESAISLRPGVLHDAQGHTFEFLDHGIDFFHSEYLLLTTTGTHRMALPQKSSIEGFVDGQVIFSIEENWKPEGSTRTLPAGSVVSIDASSAAKDPLRLKPVSIFTPSTTEFSQSVDVTRDCVLVTTLENVQGRAYTYRRDPKSGWQRHKLDVPDNSTVTIATTSDTDNHFFVGLTGFLTPSSLWIGDASGNTFQQAKTLPPQFDASRDVVEQLTAVSKDGTKVPYFVVHRKDLKYDGSNPTLLYAYGGFQISETPTYNAIMGKLWLERGGVYVLANIRGGGEFGPAWHDAGLKTHRQRIYDDFYAVARDLIDRKITSSRHLGIEGGSNGGLLMGVEMTQHPEMWNAIIIGVPLLDMLGYEHIAAGASWVGEYGSVSNPNERDFLATISPYNRLNRDVKYPEPLIFTTTKDDRVGPVHARKFAAKMEEYGKPFYYREIIEGGHSNGADLKEQAATAAADYTYLTGKLM